MKQSSALQKDNFKQVMAVLLALYLLLRILAWDGNALLEDHDSVFLLENIRDFLSGSLARIAAMHPDATPLYPFFGAVAARISGSIEQGARFASLAFSVLLFFSVASPARRFTDRRSAGLGLLLIALHPVLIGLSYSVLTEPAYIGICYAGLAYFLARARRSDARSAAVLGMIFGCSFLARTEGLLYLAVIPFMHVIRYCYNRAVEVSKRRLLLWILTYVLVFGLVAAPQIWRVSAVMKRFAINGRQAWTLILKNNDGKSYEEKVYGLTHSPRYTNLDYAIFTPEAQSLYVDNLELSSYAGKALDNMKEFCTRTLWSVLGPFGILFFAAGALALYRKRRREECLMSALFLGAALIGPLIHDVAIRHIAIILPLMLLIAAEGMVSVYDIAAKKLTARAPARRITAAVIFMLMAGAFLPGLAKTYQAMPSYSYEYNPATIQKYARLIREYSRAHSIDAPKVCSRRIHLRYYAGVEGIHLPYTDYEGLLRYLRLNGVDFLFLEYRFLSNRPFLRSFTNGEQHGDLELIDRQLDDYGRPVELYFVKPAQTQEE